jgi:hypothetical protein
MSTIRFSDLVKTAGSPEPKSLWTDPKKDLGFMRAVKQNRVLTVVQEPSSTKKDYAEIGFHQQPFATYFVFPKSLPVRQGKVIGIKYDLVEQSRPNDVVPLEDLKKEPKAVRGKSLPKEHRQPTEHSFSFRVRRVATIETHLLVKARNKTEARKKAEQITNGQGFELSQAKIQNQIMFASRPRSTRDIGP